MRFIDSHCHLDLKEFDSDRQSVLADCGNSSIAAIVVPGVNLPIQHIQWQKAKGVCVHYGVGVHPWWLEQYQNGGYLMDELAAEIIRAHKNAVTNSTSIVAIGETGLDRPFVKKGGLDLNTQIKSVEQHIQAANELSLPVIFHCVKAHAELLGVLKRCPVNKGGVVHGFAGSVEDAKQFIDKGMKIGIGGTITYERANKTREAVKTLSQQDLLLETDAPSMPLAGMQGLRNSPLNIIKIAEELAKLRGESLEVVAKYTTRNACELFGIAI